MCLQFKKEYKITVKNLQENRKRKLKSRHTACAGPGFRREARLLRGQSRPVRLTPPREATVRNRPRTARGPGGAGLRRRAGRSRRGGRGFARGPELLSRRGERGRESRGPRAGRGRSAAAMQAADAAAGASGAAGGSEGPGRRGAPGGRGRPRGAGAAAVAAAGVPPVARAQRTSEEGGDPASAAKRPRSRAHVLYPARGDGGERAAAARRGRGERRGDGGVGGRRGEAEAAAAGSGYRATPGLEGLEAVPKATSLVRAA